MVILPLRSSLRTGRPPAVLEEKAPFRRSRRRRFQLVVAVPFGLKVLRVSWAATPAHDRRGRSGAMHYEPSTAWVLANSPAATSFPRPSTSSGRHEMGGSLSAGVDAGAATFVIVDAASTASPVAASEARETADPGVGSPDEDTLDGGETWPGVSLAEHAMRWWRSSPGWSAVAMRDEGQRFATTRAGAAGLQHAARATSPGPRRSKRRSRLRRGSRPRIPGRRRGLRGAAREVQLFPQLVLAS